VTFPDEVLMAYADDELDAGTRAAVEAAMASDPEIAGRIARHKALRSRVHAAFNRVAGEPVPARLLEAVSGEPSDSRTGNVVPLRRPRVRNWSWPQWTAIAASLIVGAIAARLMLAGVGSGGPIAIRGDRMLAAGALSAALSEQLAGAQTAGDPVRLGVTFRSKSGQYCRTFTLHQPIALAGLACRTHDGWQLGVLARVESAAADSDAYRQAASSMPAAVAAAVGEQIVGEPLDRRSEADARARHWRP
jgi:hypothetical protein